MELMASHDFQTALQNYLDLEDLRSKLVVVADELRRLRGHHPAARAELRAAAARGRCAVPRARFADAPAPRAARAPRQAAAGDADRAAAGLSRDRGRADRVASGSTRIERQLGDAATPETQALQAARRSRLRGALTWRCETQYHERLTEAHVHLNELNARRRGADRAVPESRQDAAGGDAQLRRLRRSDRRGCATRRRSAPACRTC